MKYLSLEVALYLYKSTKPTWMGFYFDVRAGAAFLEPLDHRKIVAILNLFHRYNFGRCSSELTELVLLLYSGGICTHYFDRLCNFDSS